MRYSLFITGLLGILSLSGLGYGQVKKDVTNYLLIPGPIYVQKKAHQLAWSSHPDVSLYKHEYLVAGDRLPNYKSMIMIDFVVTESIVDQVMLAKPLSFPYNFTLLHSATFVESTDRSHSI